MMNEKWTIVFKMVDFNKDGAVTIQDKTDCIESFINAYTPDGDKKQQMVNRLNTFWDKVVFLTDKPDWSRSFTLDEFLASREQAFAKDRAGTIAAVREALTQLIEAADVNGTRKFSYEQFKKLHEAFNLKDENLIKGIYSFSSPDGDGVCTVSNIAGFYTELSMGSDEEKHQQYKAGLAAVGFM